MQNSIIKTKIRNFSFLIIEHAMFDYRDCSLGPKNLKIFLMVCEIIIQKSFGATKCNLYTNFAFKNLFY